jgi:hypothetical protein
MTRNIINIYELNETKPAIAAETVVSSNTDDKELNLVAIASSDDAHYNRPRSPISGEEMVVVECGAYNSPKFKTWVSIRDRIVIPYRS